MHGVLPHKSLVLLVRPVLRAASAILAIAGLVSCANGPRPLSLADREVIVDARMRMNPWDVTKPVDGRDPVLLSVLFDGTRNDRSRVQGGEQATIVAHIQDMVDSGGALYRPARYYRGVGTSGGWLPRLFDSAFGITTVPIAMRACVETMDDIKQIFAEHPQADLRILVAGFSRGAASARHFMNLLERGCADSAQAQLHPHVRYHALLFDTVATGQRWRLRLHVPSSADKVLHFVSLDERRILFKPVIDENSDRERVLTIPLPGVHSDDGASYKYGIGEEYRSLVQSVIYQMGLSPNNHSVLRRDYGLEGGNDSRWLLEKLLGIGPSRSIGDRGRSSFFVRPAPLSPTRQDEWNRRAGHLFSERAFITDSRPHVLPAFDVTWECGGYTLTAVGPRYTYDYWTSSFRDPTIVADMAKPFLQYRGLNGRVQKITLSRAVLQRLKGDRTVRLELGVVQRDGAAPRYWWLVDGVVVGRPEATILTATKGQGTRAGDDGNTARQRRRQCRPRRDDTEPRRQN